MRSKFKAYTIQKRIHSKSVVSKSDPKIFCVKTTKDFFELRERSLEKDVDISECRYVFGEEEKYFSKEEIEYQVNVGGTAEIGYEQARETSVRFLGFF